MSEDIVNEDSIVCPACRCENDVIDNYDFGDELTCQECGRLIEVVNVEKTIFYTSRLVVEPINERISICEGVIRELKKTGEDTTACLKDLSDLKAERDRALARQEEKVMG